MSKSSLSGAALVAALLSVLCVTPAIGCGAVLGLNDLTDRPPGDGGAGDTAPNEGGPPLNPDAVGATTASKVDVLLVIDDSASMSDKAKLLASSIDLPLRAAALSGDVHLGVITTSLGSMGGDVCSGGGNSNRLAHLSTLGPGGTPVASAAKGYLELTKRGSADEDAFIADARQLVLGVAESGCGLEAQLESAYRFLAQPDPWASIKLSDKKQAQYVDVDEELLKQRKAFLRPDSLVVVIMLTDEDDSSADPRSMGGQGWAFMNNTFPGSGTFRADGKSTTAPRATSACATSPGSPDCASCACNPANAACAAIKNDPECKKNGGFYGGAEDQLNVRFHRMKERYGVDPQFPLARYVEAFTKVKVPNREGEHAVTTAADGSVTVADYLGKPTCTNPLFAATLPDPKGNLCDLPVGNRGKELVLFALIGGVPETLVNGDTPEWTKILGADPGAFDLSDQDPHMIQSTAPRPGLAPPTATRGDNGSDLVHGREWDTGNDDLQFACTFLLPTARNCTAQDPSCDCAGTKNPPLCGATPGNQIKAKGYPTIRELRVVKELGERGIAGSICPAGGATYSGTLSRLVQRISSRVTL